MNASSEDSGSAIATGSGGRSGRPTAGSERIVALDILRGIALLGIVIANVNGFAQPGLAYFWPPAMTGGASETDGWFWLAQFVAIDGKARGLFAILFGAGIVLFVEHGGDDRSAMLRQARRLFWLALFGLAHLFFLFQGDILFAYATGGLMALVAVQLEGRQLLVAGLVWGVAGALLHIMDYVPAALVEAGGSTGAAASSTNVEILQTWWAGQLADSAREAAIYAQGSYGDVVAWRLAEEIDQIGFSVTLNFYETIPLMLIGMGLYRLGFFSGEQAGRKVAAMAWAGVALGTILNLAAGWIVLRGGFQPMATQLTFFGFSKLFNLPFLVGGTVLLAGWASWLGRGWLAERLAAMGRMALTNYIGTSLVLMLVFQGWAGGLYGTLDRVGMIPAIALVWALMFTASRLWLARYRQGPLEWLWRCLTYWRMLPLRK